MVILSPDSLPIDGRYQIRTWIGAGGMQNVYHATDKLFRRDVALKTPKDGAALARFQNSAIISAKVNHENVAKTLDYIEIGNSSFLVEELVLGIDLSQLVPACVPCLPPSTCIRILHQLAKGLAASHNAGVIHRDLKPSNIMVVGGAKFEAIKITDFGIAKLAEAEIGQWAGGDGHGSTSSKTVLGAIPYMAPESIENFKMSSFPADVWAIAAITYELLSGKKPFGGQLMSIPKILNAVPPPRPSAVDKPQFRRLGNDVYGLILKCLQKLPAARPKADELVKWIETICYPVDITEFGTISRKHSSTVGFIDADVGKDVMCHKESFYGVSSISVGDRVWFSRHPGLGNDRAFPLVKC